MEWRGIPGWPGYQINQRGRVRTVNGYGMTVTKAGIYLLTRDGGREKVAMSELLALAFPPAPEPAPAPAPEPALEPVPAEPIDEEFAPIAHIPGFEISRAGVVRNAATKNIIKLRTHPDNDAILWFGAPYKGSGQINVLLVETFGPGAAEAAGFPEPDMRKVESSRKVTAERRDPSLPSKKVQNNPNKRKCASCGKPTVNYRCSKCWEKIRGFGLDDHRMTVYGE